MPHRSEFAINAACTLATIAVDRACCLQLIGLDGDFAIAEPKRLRYRILHTAARLVRGPRRRPRLPISRHLALGRPDQISNLSGLSCSWRVNRASLRVVS
jgi:hypothetical protein